MALTVAADRKMFVPNFVFKGESGGDVAREIRAFCDRSAATFSVRNAWLTSVSCSSGSTTCGNTSLSSHQC